jgi:O-antigen ligase
MAIFYFGSSIVRDRVDTMHSEITNYQWSAVNPDTSIGHRINWIRIGWYYFSMRPLSGWGNDSLANNMDDDSIAMYASKASRDELLAVGFHNDFVANTVRYGIGGLVAIIAIFLIPFLFFFHCLRHQSVQSYAMVGIAYVLIQSVSSLSYHVLDFKFMASFYALMIGLLMGVIVNKLKS